MFLRMRCLSAVCRIKGSSIAQRLRLIWIMGFTHGVQLLCAMYNSCTLLIKVTVNIYIIFTLLRSPPHPPLTSARLFWASFIPVVSHANACSPATHSKRPCEQGTLHIWAPGRFNASPPGFLHEEAFWTAGSHSIPIERGEIPHNELKVLLNLSMRTLSGSAYYLFIPNIFPGCVTVKIPAARSGQSHLQSIHPYNLFPFLLSFLHLFSSSFLLEQRYKRSSVTHCYRWACDHPVPSSRGSLQRRNCRSGQRLPGILGKVLPQSCSPGSPCSSATLGTGRWSTSVSGRSSVCTVSVGCRSIL